MRDVYGHMEIQIIRWSDTIQTQVVPQYSQIVSQKSQIVPQYDQFIPIINN